MTTIARIDGLTITTAGGAVVLDQIAVELRRGEVVGLLGESGAGKTTLAHALLGHLGTGLQVAAGHVDVTGHDPFSPDGEQALRGRAVGYVPQDPASALNPRGRVGTQLRTAARIAHPHEARRPRRQRIDSAARAAALDERLLRRRPAQVSGGQAQRVLLAAALVTRPQLIILDEPTSGLDPEMAQAASMAFTRLPWRPAILLVSHDRALIEHMADRTCTMHAGRLVAGPKPSGTPTAGSAARTHRTTQAATTQGPRGSGTDGLVVEDVTIRRGGQHVVDHAGFGVGAGELVALRGVSGSGKTSLARAVCGLAPPHTGRLRLNGDRLGWDGAQRARAGGAFLAYVGQDARSALNPHETVRRTLTRALAVAHRFGRSSGWHMEGLLERVALPAELLDRTPDRLSGGQRHRLALARAIAAGPAVLVCDETTASLDPGTQLRVLDALDQLRHLHRMPVLLITHDEDVAARADRAVTLSEGQVR